MITIGISVDHACCFQFSKHNHEGKQIALHRISYQKKDMVVNAHHYRRLTVKQSFDIENTLLEGDNVIDFPIVLRDLSRYDEVLS